MELLPKEPHLGVQHKTTSSVRTGLIICSQRAFNFTASFVLCLLCNRPVVPSSDHIVTWFASSASSVSVPQLREEMKLFLGTGEFFRLTTSFCFRSSTRLHDQKQKNVKLKGPSAEPWGAPLQRRGAPTNHRKNGLINRMRRVIFDLNCPFQLNLCLNPTRWVQFGKRAVDQNKLRG